MNLHQFSIKSIDDVLICTNLAGLLEISGWPKPGNVHRTKNFKETRFEHFLAGISAIQIHYQKLCVHIKLNLKRSDNDYSFIKLGEFYSNAAEEMIRWQKGGNVLLGHILILAPLIAASVICLVSKRSSLDNFQNTIQKVITDATVDDTIGLYEAIRICQPGGLGKAEKYDLNDDNAFKDIRENNITLKKIFTISKEYDMISNEYSTNYNIVLNEGLPYFLNQIQISQDINVVVVNTFLRLLSKYPDTLIIRKAGIKKAKEVTEQALRIIELGGISSENGLKMAFKLDQRLHESSGKFNPGSTADLLAGIIFCALLYGIRF